MFGLGLTEIVVILVVALLFLGPDKLPEIAKSLGKGLREFRKITDDVRDTVNTTVTQAVREVARPPAPPAGAAAPVPKDPFSELAPAAPPDLLAPAVSPLEGTAAPSAAPALTQPVAEPRVPQDPGHQS